MTKLLNNRGETLVEVLASILIAALALSLLFSFTMTSSSLQKDHARDKDTSHYQSISGAESGGVTASGITPAKIGEGTVVIYNADLPTPTSITSPIDVDIYGGDGMFSYARRG